jgi:putative transposase
VVPEPTYPGHAEHRLVSKGGVIKFHGRELFLARALAGETVGFEEVADGLWNVLFYDVLLARYDQRAGVLVP